ncbi:MAG: hypothetical protein R6X02_09575 [Enhygromyxa sp.]
MTIHRAPGMLKEQWVENSDAVYAGQHAKFEQAHVNLQTGFVFTIYTADSREKLIEQFEEIGLPFDEIHEIQFSQSHAEMVEMLKQMGRI